MQFQARAKTPNFAPSVANAPSARPKADRAAALRDYREGRYAEAAATLSAVARATPRDPAVWSDLGVVRAALGEHQLAIDCYDRALAIQATHSDALGNKGVALSALGRHQEALACYERALAFDPGSAEHINNRGGAVRALGRIEEALACFDAALALQPDFIDALNNRANALLDLRRGDEAIEIFEHIRKLAPNSPNFHINYAAALLKIGKPEAALANLDHAIALAPRSPEAHNNRGEALRMLQRPTEAAQAFFSALSLRPKFAEAFSNLGQTFLELRLVNEALAALRTALNLDPDLAPALRNLAQAQIKQRQFAEALRATARDPRDADSHNMRGVALANLGRETEALASYDAAIALDPDSDFAYNNKGLLLVQLGRVAEGRAMIEAAIARAPQAARAYYNLSLTRSFASGDAIFDALQPVIQRPSHIDPEDIAMARFALGKAYADIGDFDSSFENLAQGNAIMRGLIPYDERAALDNFRRLGVVARRELFANRSGGDPSDVPVFIVGMPRSGTSLLEQILAGTPGVHGAGEISDFDLAAREIGGAVAESLERPEAIAEIAPEDLKRLGADYVRRLRALAPDARRIVNKMPENFRLASLIALSLPKAKIIHIRRDPRDTCLSCFSILFTENLPYTHDLGELGRYYAAYQTLMDQFRAALPPGMMLDVRYEDLVAHIEAESRRVVEHCGLDWDPACLEFHKRDRVVRTASLGQVRKPLFSSSIGRWRAYAKHLGPLLEALRLRAED